MNLEKLARQIAGNIMEHWRGHDHAMPYREFLARHWAIVARKYGISFADRVKAFLPRP